MFVNTQQSKGFKKAANTSSDKHQIDEPEVVKQAFPFKQFMLACLCLLIAIICFLFVSTFTTLKPDPLEQNNAPFSLSELNYYIERNAPLRVPVINSEQSINGMASFSQNVALRFQDNRKVILTKDLTNTENTLAYQIQLLNDSNFTYPPVILPYTDTSRILSSEHTRKIDDLLDQLAVSDKDVPLKLHVYAFRGNGASQEPAQEASQKQDESAFTLPSQNPFQYISSLTRLADTLISVVHHKPALFRSMFVKDPKKGIPEQLDVRQQEQKTIPQAFYNDFEQVSNTLLMEQLEQTRTYIINQIEDRSIDLDLSYETVPRRLANQSEEYGLIVEVSQSLPELVWQDVDSNYKALDKNLQGIAFEVLNQNIINLIGDDGISQTIAILPSALQTYYKNETDYSELSPQSYPSILSIITLVLGIACALYVLAYRQTLPDADIVKKQLLVDSFVSDAPASNLSQDKLGFAEISSALSRFLRNVGTKAPLTLAITGAWGSGKSSLMYFLKENLLQFHMQPVWVNAWHHQNEEQFLAGLLSAIRRGAIPPFWTSAGVLYRWNLLKMRWLDAPFFYYSFAFIFLASLTFILTADTTFLTRSNDLSLESLPFISAVLAAIPIINAGMDKISRLSKASLVQTLLKGSRQSLDLRANIGLREKFATEFGLLCNALGDSTLTIFIDDLDRCKENRIMDVMETINYLVSSGDCFIVLAMEREPVEKAVESYYKSTHSELDTDKLKLKARRYLEKIINIEIPVPNANEEQFNALVKVKDTPVKATPFRWLKQFAVVASLLISIALGHFLASILHEPQAKTEISVDKLAKPSSYDNRELFADSIENIVEQSSADSPIKMLSLEQNESQSKTEWIVIPMFFIAAIGMLIRAERYRQRKRIVENDSEPFLLAISIWARVMGMSNKTPRSIKRFVNRTRFLAMRNAESATNIKEENLVTLAALIDLAKDRGLSNLEDIEQHLPQIDNLEFKHQVDTLIRNCHLISADKKAQLQGWIRGFNVS